MKEKILNSTINFLKNNNDYSESELMKLRYGLEGIYLTITKTIIILLVAFFLNIFIEVILGIIFFNIIRYFAFGFHAEKSFDCLVLSLFNFILIPYFFLNTNISLEVNLIICIVCLFLIALFAPADTIKRPLKDKKKRIIRKILTLITGLVYTVITLLFNDNSISDLLISSLITTVIVVWPLTYMIYGQPYNNYKKLN